MPAHASIKACHLQAGFSAHVTHHNTACTHSLIRTSAQARVMGVPERAAQLCQAAFESMACSQKGEHKLPQNTPPEAQPGSFTAPFPLKVAFPQENAAMTICTLRLKIAMALQQLKTPRKAPFPSRVQGALLPSHMSKARMRCHQQSRRHHAENISAEVHAVPQNNLISSE